MKDKIVKLTDAILGQETATIDTSVLLMNNVNEGRGYIGKLQTVIDNMKVIIGDNIALTPEHRNEILNNYLIPLEAQMRNASNNLNAVASNVAAILQGYKE